MPNNALVVRWRNAVAPVQGQAFPTLERHCGVGTVRTEARDKGGVGFSVSG